MAIAFIFPGQGSQFVGMGKALAAASPQAQAIFDEVDEALGQKLSTLMWEGPEADLTLTANAQPALMAVSLAALAMLKAEHGIEVQHHARFVAGHSLGEYSAIAAAQGFTVADAARLLRARGEAMQKAAPLGTGAMAAILGLDFPEVDAVAREAAQGDVCQAANDNSNGQVVISGHRAAVERACDLAKAKGAKRAVMLPVSAPFHSALMAPAAKVMAEALSRTSIQRLSVPLIANVTARPAIEADDIRHKLVEQVTGAVRWRESIAYMAEQGVDLFYEIGPGRILTGLLKKNAPEARGLTIGTPEDMASVDMAPADWRR